MSLYQLQKLLFNLHNRLELRPIYGAAPQEILKDYDLSENERQAIVKRDMRALYRMGVNPWLLYQFSHIVGIAREDYIKQIRGG